MPALKKAPSQARKTPPSPALKKAIKAGKAVPPKKSGITTEAQARGLAFVRPVLEITLAELAEQGYERLSIPRIAQLAGVNKTSIYRRWPGKLELVQEAVHAAMRHTQDVPDTGSLRGDLLALAQAVAAFMQSPVGQAVVRMVISQAHPELRALAGAAYAQAGQKAGQEGPWRVMQRAVLRGELAPETDASLMLFTLAGGLMHRVFVEQRPADAAFVQQLVDLLLKAVLVKAK
jgi:AcrR family transcriptional regulator